MANPFNCPWFQFPCSPNKPLVAGPSKRPRDSALRKSQLGLTASQVALVVRNHQPANAGDSDSTPSEMGTLWRISPEIQDSLGWEDALEKVMSAPSRILAWRIPWTGEPVMRSQRVRHD